MQLTLVLLRGTLDVRSTPSTLPKESFRYPDSQRVLDLLDDAGQRSGVSRGQVFEDFLQMSLCALSGGRLENQYLEVVKKHSVGPRGK
jgi:hypothetical protein